MIPGQKVSKGQLLSYVMEAILVAYAACILFSHGEFFVFGGLVALAVATALQCIGAILINRDIKKESK